ncbi:MAG: hypothetical protein EXS09_14855 [Gemmataceae bacterium]|nr:hypothetical protein [Gemmataceae bacterium]
MNLLLQHSRLGNRMGLGQTSRVPWGQAVAGVLPIYLLIHFALRLQEGNTLRWDESEQTLFSQRLALGYNDQPPIYTWLLWTVFQVTGVSLLGLHVLKSLILSAFYIGTYAAARKLVEPKFALLGTLSLLLTPYFAWTALIDGAHTLFVAAFVPVAFLVVLRLLDRPSSGGFALLGLVVGLGVLAKYSFAILAVAIPLSLLTMPAYRSRLKDPRLLWTVAVAAIVVLPHAWWLHSHWQLVSERPMARSGVVERSAFTERIVTGLSSLSRTSLLSVGSLLTVLLACFPKGCVRILLQPAESDRVRWLGRWLTIVCAILIVLVLLGVSKFRTHWLIPLLVLFPAYVFARFAECPSPAKAQRQLLALVTLVILAVIAVRLAGVISDSHEGGKNWGQAKMHAEVASHLSAHDLEQATIFGDHPIACGNIRRSFPHATVVCSYYPAFVPETQGDCYVAWEATHLAEPMPGFREWLEKRGLQVRYEQVVFFEIPTEQPNRGLRRIGFAPAQTK